MKIFPLIISLLIAQPEDAFYGENSVRLVPDTGRLIVTIKSTGLKTLDAVLNENSNFNVIVSKLKKLDAHDITLLKRDWNDDYDVVEIWGGATHRGNFMTKKGYAVYSTIDVSLKPKNLQAAIDVVNSHKIHAAGYSSSNEETVLKESTKIALLKAMEQIKPLDLIVVGTSSETTGERISPAMGISIQLKTKVKIHVKTPQSITP